MAEATEPTKAEESKSKTPELTKPVDFIVPQQDLIEQVIDQRLAAHAGLEETNTKSTSTRSRTSSTSTNDNSKS